METITAEKEVWCYNIECEHCLEGGHDEFGNFGFCELAIVTLDKQGRCKNDSSYRG